MPTNGTEDRSGREIRLLLLVIAVAVAGLLVLARFRFPEAEIVTVSPTPNPLERLATRAPFDDLAGVVAEGTARVRPWLAIVELERAPEKPTRKSGGAAPPVPAAERILMAGLRVRPDIVIAYAPAGTSATMLGGMPAQTLGTDPQREVALVGPDRAAEAGVPNAEMVDFGNAVSSFAGSTYVLAAEAAAYGPAVMPVFIPRVDPVTVEHWPTPLLQIGGDARVPAGAFLFMTDGRLIGLVVPIAAGLAIVDAGTIDRLVGELTGNRQ